MRAILTLLLFAMYSSIAFTQSDDPSGSSKSHLNLTRNGRLFFLVPGTTGQFLTTNGTTLSWANSPNTDDQTAAEVSVAATPTNYTNASGFVEGHLAGIDTQLGTITSSHALGLLAPANGDSITLTNRETLIVLEDIFADPTTIYLDGSGLLNGSKIYIKYGNFSTGATIDRDDDNDPGNFIQSGSTSGSSSVGFTGTGFSAFIKSGSTWYQMY